MLYHGYLPRDPGDFPLNFRSPSGEAVDVAKCKAAGSKKVTFFCIN